MMSNAQKPTEGTAPKPAAMHVTANTRPTVTYVSTNTKPTVTHVSTNTKPMVTYVSTNTKPTVTHVTTNTRPMVMHVTTNNKPTAMQVSPNTKPTATQVSTNIKSTATHVSTNTKPAVTQATTKAEPTESPGSEEVTIVKTVLKKRPPRDKYGPEGKLGKYEYDLISSPNGWLDCVIIHEAHILLKKISTSIQGFQRPTLGPVHQFDNDRPLIQIVNINNNLWELFLAQIVLQVMWQSVIAYQPP